MDRRTPHSSPRMRRAAAAELAELDGRRDQLQRTRAELRARIDEIDLKLIELEEHEVMLRHFVDPPHAEPSTQLPSEASRSADGDSVLLRGTAVRETAVRLLIADRHAARPIHYREWFALLQRAGFEVAGKDPLAVFLTQISRAPMIRRSTAAGMYELDRAAPDRLHNRLSRLQADLRRTTAPPTSTTDLAAIRAERDDIMSQIAQIERALEECARVLSDDPPIESASPLAATG